MKKIIAVLLLILVGCSSTNAQADKESRFSGAFPAHFYIIEDNKTSCKYLVFDRRVGTAGSGGITPLLTSTGEPDCRTKE